jgi:mercuric ion transport protein
MTMLEEYRPILMVVTFAFLATAFYLTYRPRAKSQAIARSSLMGFNKILLWAVTVVAIIMLFFPNPTDLFNSNSRFTSDMQRTVFQIEGMT